MNLDFILRLTNRLLGEKNPRSDHLTPEMITKFLSLANWKKFKIETEADNMDNLLPFKVVMGDHNSMPLTIDKYGIADKPANYYKNHSMVYNHVINGVGHERVIEVVPRDETFDDLVASSIDKPTRYFPLANIQATTIRFSPKDLRYVNFIYIKKPDEPVYAYKTDKGYVQYDEGDSVQLQWDEVNQVDVIYFLLELLGLSLKKGELVKQIQQQKVSEK